MRAEGVWSTGTPWSSAGEYADEREELAGICAVLANTDPDAAGPVLNELQQAMNALSGNTGADPGSGTADTTPRAKILHCIEHWEGDGKEAFFNWTTDLGATMTGQLSCAKALHLTIQTHSSSVAAAQELILNTCDAAIDKLTERAGTRRSQKKSDLAMVLGITKAIVDGISTGAVMTVAKMLLGVGTFLVEAEPKVGGRNAKEILESTARELRKVIKEVDSDQGKLVESLELLQTEFFSLSAPRAREVLAPGVGWEGDRKPGSYAMQRLPIKVSTGPFSWNTKEAAQTPVSLPDPVVDPEGATKFSHEEFKILPPV